MAWPEAATLSTRCRCCAASSPTMKNVARASYRSRILRTSGVISGCGPSSKVRAIAGHVVLTCIVVARDRATASRRANDRTLRKRKCTRNEYQYYLWQRLGDVDGLM